MAVHRIFALILGTEVKGVIVCDEYPMANKLAKDTYGIDAFAIDVTQVPVSAGDKYHDNCFWSVDPNTGKETRIIPIPTVEEQVKTNLEFSKEVFELLKTVANTSLVVFTENSSIVEMYGDDYMKTDYNLNAIPNIGNLRTIILQIYGTGPASN